MDVYLLIIILLVVLAISAIIVGVGNDAVNFLSSSIGSRVAPFRTLMIIASLGMLVGVTSSNGMMEVARKGIFMPELFTMPQLLTIFLAVMLTDIFLLDLFNTFGLPTSTTVSIVFELLGAAVAISLIQIYTAGNTFEELINYINTAKALAIITGILLSVFIAFVCGALSQFFSRLIFTFDYKSRLKRYGGIWGGFAMSVIAYFILIKGAKGASFLTPEIVTLIKANAWLIMAASFVFFGIIFQFMAWFTRINVLKPIVLVGTFSLAMAFAGNDLVNFIGVPLAGLESYKIAMASPDPEMLHMAALQKKIHTNTFLLLGAGIIMIITLWASRKTRSVIKTSVDLSRQEDGEERFGSFALSRVIVGMANSLIHYVQSFTPHAVKKSFTKRFDLSAASAVDTYDGRDPAFDLLRASVNLIVASAVVSYATSMKLPLSTTYVTFMVAMGTSLADRAWGKESAVYRVTGVLAVVGGWFCTAFIAFIFASLFAMMIYYFKLWAIVALVLLIGFNIWKSSHYHAKKEKEADFVKNLHLKDGIHADFAIETSFEQVGYLLNEICYNLRICFDALIREDRYRLRELKAETSKVQQRTNTIIANIFKTLYLLNAKDVEYTGKYSRTVGTLQDIAECHRDIILRAYTHVSNFHSGLLEAQKKELQQVRIATCRLLGNTSIMLLKNKKVDYDYINNQKKRLEDLIHESNKNQIQRIQNAETKTRLSILHYGFLENCEKISVHTQNLLEIFREYFLTGGNGASPQTSDKDVGPGK